MYESYTFMGAILLEGSRGYKRLKRRGDVEGAKRKAKEGSIRKAAAELEGHAQGSKVDHLMGNLVATNKKGNVWPPHSTEHNRAHKGRGVRAEDNPSFGKKTSREETKPQRRAARRAISRASGESEAKKREIGHAVMKDEEQRKQRSQFDASMRASTNEQKIEQENKMNQESILIALYESYTQIGALLSELTTLRQDNPYLKPTTREVDMPDDDSSDPVVSNRARRKTKKVKVTEDPKARKAAWQDARARLEGRRAFRGLTATGQPKKGGVVSELFGRKKKKK